MAKNEMTRAVRRRPSFHQRLEANKQLMSVRVLRRLAETRRFCGPY
jgi:hypothetical protein